MTTMKLFTGTANPILTQRIAQDLHYPFENAIVSRFSDGEIRVELEENVRGCRAFIVQSTCAPTNDTLMEVILLADALKRSSVTEIYAIIPYFGYARQDRRPGYARVPISAAVVAELIEAVGISHVITMDIHAAQIQGFFSIPVDNLNAMGLFASDIRQNHDLDDVVVVSPDVGGVARARQLAKQLNNCDLAIIDKRRPQANVSEVMNIIGNVSGKHCIIADDMVDTAGTLAKAASAIINIGGAASVTAYATHGVLSGQAHYNVESSPLKELVITDTIPLQTPGREYISDKVRQISIAPLLAETIRRVNNNQSISEILE